MNQLNLTFSIKNNNNNTMNSTQGLEDNKTEQYTNQRQQPFSHFSPSTSEKNNKEG